jgi:hypothetical protein
VTGKTVEKCEDGVKSSENTKVNLTIEGTLQDDSLKIKKEDLEL